VAESRGSTSRNRTLPQNRFACHDEDVIGQQRSLAPGDGAPEDGELGRQSDSDIAPISRADQQIRRRCDRVSAAEGRNDYQPITPHDCLLSITLFTGV
jgi:hypothetical protein